MDNKRRAIKREREKKIMKRCLLLERWKIIDGRKLNFYISHGCVVDIGLHDFRCLETKIVFILDTILSWTI